VDAGGDGGRLTRAIQTGKYMLDTSGHPPRVLLIGWLKVGPDLRQKTDTPTDTRVVNLRWSVQVRPPAPSTIKHLQVLRFGLRCGRLRGCGLLRLSRASGATRSAPAGPAPAPSSAGRAQCSSVVRSLGLTITRTTGRPRFAICASLYQKRSAPYSFQNFRSGTLVGSRRRRSHDRRRQSA
jgi:hypothetical protein